MTVDRNKSHRRRARRAGALRSSAGLVLYSIAAAFCLGGEATAQDQGQSDTIYDPAYFTLDDDLIADLALPAFDPAIDNQNRRVAWRDDAGDLRVATLSPRDGRIESIPADGIVIDGDLWVGQNVEGPQWVYGEGTARLVYTKNVAGTPALAMATEQPDETWSSELLVDGQNRFLIGGTPAGHDGPAYILYGRLMAGSEVQLEARPLDDPAATVVVLDMTAVGGQWIAGRLAFSLTVDRSGVRQAAIFDVPTSALTVLTEDAREKSSPVVWLAPETGAEILAVVENDQQIGLYEDQGGPAWTRTTTLIVPSARPFLRALESFVYRGRSYLLTVASDSPDTIAIAQVWIAGIDAGQPFYRQLTDPARIGFRSGPGIYFPWASPFVVYSEFQVNPTRWTLRRSDTGLLTEWGYESPHYGGPWAVIHRGNRNSDSAPIGMADNYEEAYITFLPHVQPVRSPIGPQGHFYIPYAEEDLEGNYTGNRFLGSYDTFASGQEVFNIGTEITGDQITAGTPLVHTSGDFFFAGNDRVGRYDELGNQLWTAPIDSVPTSFQFAPDGNLALFSNAGFAYIIDPEDGTIYRERDMRDPNRDLNDCLQLGIDPLCPYVNTPAVDPFKRIIFNTYTTLSGTASIHAYDYSPVARDLRIRWTQPALEGGSAATPVISSDYRRIYAQDRADNLVAMDADTGAVLWTFDVGFTANGSPNVSDTGYIVPGGGYGWNYVGLIQDKGDRAEFVFQDFGWMPQSNAVAGADDMWAMYAHRVGDFDDLHLVIFHPERGIISTVPWVIGDRPRKLVGISLREDGWLFVNVHGLNGFKATRPVW